MKTQDIVFIALFAALTAVLGMMPRFPLPIAGVAPITFQSLAPMLAGSILGAKRGGLSLLLFILLVAIGLPILSGGYGGISTLIGPWSGYVWGWAIAAFVIGYLVEKNWQHYNMLKGIIFNVIGGIAIIYLCGISWFALINNSSFTDALYSSIFYLPGDLIKVIVATIIALKVKQSYPLIKK